DPDPEHGEDDDRDAQRPVAHPASAASSAGASAAASRLVSCTRCMLRPVRPTSKLGVELTPTLRAMAAARATARSTGGEFRLASMRLVSRPGTAAPIEWRSESVTQPVFSVPWFS